MRIEKPKNGFNQGYSASFMRQILKIKSKLNIDDENQSLY